MFSCSRLTSWAKYSSPFSPYVLLISHVGGELQVYTLWTNLSLIKGRDTTIVDNSKIIIVMMRFGNCLNLQRLEREGGSNGVHVLGGGSALAGCVVVWLVADHGFGGDVQTLFIILPVERGDVQCYVRTDTNSVSPSSGWLQMTHLWISHMAPFPTHKVTFLLTLSS